MTESHYNGGPLQPATGNATTELREPPVMTVSTAALRIGLAHFIHEINNPLQLIYSTANMMDTLMPKANGSGDPFVGKMFQGLRNGVDQLIALISSLRSQLESLWMINPSFDAVNLSALIDEILHSHAATFDTCCIRVHMDIAAHLPAIHGDKQLLRHVFLNLFKNAVDAMPKGGVLSVTAGARERSLWLELSDTGIGIPPDLDVFQPFVTSKPKGMGLGLAITRHIIETHRGTISYRSQPGTGTTFSLSFPRMIETKTISGRREPAEDDDSDGVLELRGDAADR